MLKALMALICSINFITGPFTKLKTDTSKLGGEVVSVYKDVSKQIISKKDELKLTEKEVKEIEELSKKLDDNKISEKDKKSTAKELYSKFKIVASKTWSVVSKAASVTLGAAIAFTTFSAIILNLFNIKIDRDQDGNYYFNGEKNPTNNILAKGFCATQYGFSKLLDFSRFKIGEKVK